MNQKWVAQLGTAIATLALLLPGTSAIAAEQVVLKYRAHERSVPVADLTRLAETGETTRQLNLYLRTAGYDAAEMQELLNREVEMDVVLLDSILNSFVGNYALDQVGKAIYPPSQRADRQALRAAIILSAADDNTVTLLEILQNYPTPEVHVDGNELANAYQTLARLQGRLDGILNRLPSSLPNWF